MAVFDDPQEARESDMAGRMKSKKPDPNQQGHVDVYVEDSEIRIRLPPTRVSRLFVDNALQAEFGLGSDGPKDFRKELRQARAARAACAMLAEVLPELTEQQKKPDHRVKSNQRAAAYAAGLESGLKGEHALIGADPQFSILPSVVEPKHKLSGPSHRRGWLLGCAILAATEIAEGRPDPRNEWGKEGT